MSTTPSGAIAPAFQSWSKSVPPATKAVPALDPWMKASLTSEARLY
jgi:hypothetical protein